jgi:O-methyltransferase
MDMKKAERLADELIAERLTLLWKPRLMHLAQVIAELEEKGVAGDLIETGCWMGGACIFMRAVLDELGNTSRKVYAADSFQGVPVPDTENYPIDAYSTHHKSEMLTAPLEQVRENFTRRGYLDDRTVIVPGWFKDTMPPLKPASGRWALLRLDGDIYESTMQVLETQYDFLSQGGYAIIDDFGSDVGASHAARDFLYRIGRIEKPENPGGEPCGCGVPECTTTSSFHPHRLGLDRVCLSAWWRKDEKG